jgi:hypothetical protein
MNDLPDILEQRRSQCAAVLERLLSATVARFDDSLYKQLPQMPGVYLIARRDRLPGEYLHAGQSPRAKGGLRSRVWTQHFTGGGVGAGSDLVQKVIDKGKAESKPEAQEWIRANCVVQWLVEEDVDVRCWAEHYMP